MVRIGVVGAAGRMGSRIIVLSSGFLDLQLAAAFERVDHPLLGQDSGRIAGGQENKVLLSVALMPEFPNLRLAGSCLPKEHVDVLIVFAPPEAAIAALALAERSGSAVVLGTTGFSDEQVTQIHAAAKRIPLVASYNMSQGVNLLYGVVAQLAKSLGEEYDIEIVEAHHRMKKDAPSGTAKAFAEIIAARRGYDLAEDAVYGRQGFVGERPKKQIGILSVRGGDVVGDHTIIFAGPGERIEITHRASSRDVFVHGALKAASWIAQQPAGLYNMQDVFRTI